MKKELTLVGFLAGIGLAVVGCTANNTATTPAPATSTVPVSTSPAVVCQDVAAVQSAPTAMTEINSISPNSALGVVWADVVSGCPGGVPATGVDTTWTQQVWTMAKGLIPQVLPDLVPLLIGLL